MNGEKWRERQINTSEHQKCEPKENKSFLSGGMISYTFFPHHFVYPFSSFKYVSQKLSMVIPVFILIL